MNAIVKIIPLKNPQGNIDGNDLPSCLDGDNKIQLEQFITDNLALSSDGKDKLMNGKDYSLIGSDLFNRNITFDNEIGISYKTSYFLVWEDNQYYFYRVVNRQITNENQISFNLSLDLGMTYGPQNIAPTLKGQMLIQQAHSDRLITHTATTIRPAFADFDNVIHNFAQEETAYNNLIPAKLVPEIKNPNPTHYERVNEGCFTSNRNFEGNDGAKENFISLSTAINYRNDITEPEPVDATRGFRLLILKNYKDSGISNGFKIKGIAYPFLVAIIPSGVKYDGLSLELRTALDTIRASYETGGLEVSPYIQNIIYANSLFIKYDGETLEKCFKVVNFKIDGTNPQPIAILTNISVDNFVCDRPLFIETLEHEFKTPTSYFTVKDYEMKKYLQSGNKNIFPLDPNVPYIIDRESKLGMSPFYYYEYTGCGTNTTHKWLPEYLLYGKNLDNTDKKSVVEYYFGIANFILPTAYVEIIFTAEGLYKRFLGLYTESLGEIIENKYIEFIDNTYFYNNPILVTLPNVSDPYLNYMATTQNTMYAGYAKRAMEAGNSSSGIPNPFNIFKILFGMGIGRSTDFPNADNPSGITENYIRGFYTPKSSMGLTEYDMDVRAHIADLKNSPETIANVPNDSVIKGAYGKDLMKIRMLNNNDRKQLYIHYYLFGYVWNRNVDVNLDFFGSRYGFNFVKARGIGICFDLQTIPMEAVAYFTELFGHGIRMRHSRISGVPTLFSDFSKENLEMKFYVPTKQKRKNSRK